MKKPSLLHCLFIGIIMVVLLSCSHQRRAMLQPGPRAGEEDPEKRRLWELHMLADPATGKIPDNIRAKELAFAATLPHKTDPQNKSGDFWQSRGPWNIGSSTRAIAIDVTKENILLAGAVSGGLWRSEDGGASWRKITGPAQDFSISCIVQDTRPGKTNTWYAGTGENIGSGVGVPGDGILKSTDGGQTFTKLASTANNTPNDLKPFMYVNSIVINTADTGDIIYAALGSSLGGIYKSSNGGKTWAAIKGTSGISFYCEVAMSKKGVLYFTRSNGSAGGIYRSADGNTITNITPKTLGSSAGCMVPAIDPNDENTVYVLASTPGAGKHDAMLLKYRFLSGDGTGTGGNWRDLTANIPDWGGFVGQTDLQGGYNMVLKVKPGDPKTIFLGATNLMRSTDSFSTFNNSEWVGGFPVNYQGKTFAMEYPNHHCDQHGLTFYPSNPSKMISVNDGGIFKTDDNGAKTIVYASLNNGYTTTQFYDVSIDHNTPGSDVLAGGMQDNGTYTTRSADGQVPWNNSFTGDGYISAITNGGNDFYLSTQQGWTYRAKLDAKGYPTQYRRVDPAGAVCDYFLVPYLIDPTDEKRMFYLTDNQLWRNDDMTKIPLNSGFIYDDSLPLPAGNGWDTFASISSSDAYAQMAMSQKPTGRMVVSTYLGRLLKTDSAYASRPGFKDITGSNFPANAYIKSIAINPNNADEMMVIFSNYGVKSIFYTRDGGGSWTDVSANLEQNPDGSGNGPACHTGAIMPVGSHYTYLIGTSTGLYGTDTLKGNKTVWVQLNPEGIGNAIVTKINTRPVDGYVAIATHGRGIYTAHISYAYQVSGIDAEDGEKLVFQFLDCYPNPVHQGENINLSFESKTPGSQLIVTILNEEGVSVFENQYPAATQTGKQNLSLPTPALKPGLYYIRLQAGDAVATRGLVVR